MSRNALLPEKQAVELFEALPDVFTRENLRDAGDRLGHSPERTTEYLKAYQRLDMARAEGDRVRKTGQVPYF